MDLTLVENRILFFDNGGAAFYFPVGDPKDGGTCAFATRKCVEHCPSKSVVTEHEERVLKYFKETPVTEIVERCLRELKEYFEDNHIGWFAWGDCLPELTEKTFEVITELHKRGINQNGFTRNKALWEKVPCLNNLRFALTCDTVEDAEFYSKEKVVCFPEVSTARARVYYKGKLRAKCSGYWCFWDDLKAREADCAICLQNSKGCFDLAV